MKTDIAATPLQPIVMASVPQVTLPKPYYDQDGITIYHGDCREILPSIEAVRAIITDPPYNVGYKYGGDVDDMQTTPDYQDWCNSWFQLAKQKAATIAVSPGIANLGMWHNIENPIWVQRLD